METTHLQQTHIKGWGSELWIVNNEKYCGKILYFAAGKRFSWHFHKIKVETFYLLEGSIIVKYSLEDDLSVANRLTLKPGDSFDVPIGMRHQLIAEEKSIVFEFSTQHFEDDSYRIERGD